MTGHRSGRKWQSWHLNPKWSFPGHCSLPVKYVEWNPHIMISLGIYFIVEDKNIQRDKVAVMNACPVGWDPSTWVKSWVQWWTPETQSWWERQVDPENSPISQPIWIMGYRLTVRDPASKNKEESYKEDTWCQALAFMCICTFTHVLLHEHVYTLYPYPLK